MKYFLVALVFLLSMGQLGRIQISQNISFYLHDILILMFFGTVIFDLLKNPKKIIEKVKKNKKFPKKIIFSLITSIFLSWIISAVNKDFDYRSILYTLRFLGYWLFAYLLQTTNHHQAKPWVLTALLLMLFGFIQYFFLPDLRFINMMGYDDHFYRLSGTILDPSFLGLILVFTLNYQLLSKKPRWLLVVLMVIAIALTYSRAVYLAFLLSTSLIAYYQKSVSWRPKLLLTIIGFILLLPALPKQSGGAGVDLDRTFTIIQRFDNNKAALEKMTAKDWLIGRGLFRPTDRNSSQTITTHAHFPDNILVLLISNLGILGTGLAVILFWQALKTSNQLQKVLFWSLLIHSMFNHNLTHSFVMMLFWGFFYSRNSTSITRSV